MGTELLKQNLVESAENIMYPPGQCDHSMKCDVEYTLLVKKGQGRVNFRDEPDDCNIVCFKILVNFSPSLSVPNQSLPEGVIESESKSQERIGS